MGAYIQRYLASQMQTLFMDKCVIQRYYTPGGTDEYGTPISSFVDSQEMECYFNVKTAKEELTTAQVDTADAVLWLSEANAESIKEADRIKITARFSAPGEPPIVYTIDGTKEYGQLGMSLPLKRCVGADNE